MIVKSNGHHARQPARQIVSLLESVVIFSHDNVISHHQGERMGRRHFIITARHNRSNLSSTKFSPPSSPVLCGALTRGVVVKVNNALKKSHTFRSTYLNLARNDTARDIFLSFFLPFYVYLAFFRRELARGETPSERCCLYVDNYRLGEAITDKFYFTTLPRYNRIDGLI